mmetsp:Transcript_9062/g.13123  ORF Transcript_9062/g.13123 Transcript_9062/m.13123 type:complete len:255 (+) Transcript_9062:1192-1956(+)
MSATNNNDLSTKTAVEDDSGTRVSTRNAISQFFLDRRDLAGLDFKIIGNGKFYLTTELDQAATKKHGAAPLQIKRDKRARRVTKAKAKLQESLKTTKAKQPRSGPLFQRVDLINSSQQYPVGAPKQPAFPPSVALSNHQCFIETLPFQRPQQFPFYSNYNMPASSYYHPPPHIFVAMEHQLRMMHQQNQLNANLLLTTSAVSTDRCNKSDEKNGSSHNSSETNDTTQQINPTASCNKENSVNENGAKIALSDTN